MNIRIGIYGNEHSKYFENFQNKIPKILTNHSIEIRRLGENLPMCDIYYVSIRSEGAFEVIERIRKQRGNACIIACCNEHPKHLRKLFDLRVNEICFYNEDPMNAITKEVESLLNTIRIKNGLQRKLKRLEEIENGSVLDPSRSAAIS